jgi:hypothetical protein
MVESEINIGSVRMLQKLSLAVKHRSMMLARRFGRGWLAICAASLAASQRFHAQELRQVTLARPGQLLTEPFTNIVAVREVADTLVLIAEDPRDVRLVAANFAANAIRQIGRLGDGPNEYRGIQTLIALGADSSLLVDWQRKQWLFLVGARIVANHPTSTATTPGGRIGRFIAGGDLSGRLLETRESKFRPSRGRSRDNADSLVVLIHHRAPLRSGGVTTSVDTIAFVKGSAGEQTRAIREAAPGSPLTWVLNSPYASEDQAILFPDSWIALVRSEPYSIQWIAPNRIPRAPSMLPLTQVEIDDRQVGDAVDRKWPRVRPPFRRNELPRLPKYLPPFGRNSLFGLPDGRLLIHRTYDVRRPGVRYDIVNRQGKLDAILRLEPNERVVSVGRRFIYVVSRDDDHVERIVRYQWPEPHP